MNNILKKLYYFLVACVWVFATIGGTAYLFFYHLPHFGVANILLAAMAFPFVYDKVKKLLEA